MAREVTYQKVEKRVTEEEEIETIRCDGCGQKVFRDDEPFANDLRIFLNPNECVSQGHGRDYCTECLDPIWQAICKLTGADPGSLSKESLEGRNY